MVRGIWPGLVFACVLWGAGAFVVPATSAGAELTGGPDFLVGTSESDELRGGDGADVISGLDGADTLFGGHGADIVLGGNGPDSLVGGPGGDRLDGGPGADSLSMGTGHDVVVAGDGRDVIFAGHHGGTALDKIDCGPGRDTVVYPTSPDQRDVRTGCELIERLDGPLRPSGAHGYSFTYPQGRAFTDGFEVLRLGGNEPAVINAVTILGSHGLSYLGAKVIGRGRAIGAVQIVFHWPPTSADYGGGKVLNAVGARITPLSENDWGWELLIGHRANQDGRVGRSGVAISYTVDGVRYRVIHHAEILVCTAPRFEGPDGCSP